MTDPATTTLRERVEQVVIDVEYDPGRGNLPPDMAELVEAIVTLIKQERDWLRNQIDQLGRPDEDFARDYHMAILDVLEVLDESTQEPKEGTNGTSTTPGYL